MTYRAISSDESLRFDARITCYAVNYISHQLFVCDKEYVRVYDLEHNNLLHHLNYSQKFMEFYDSKITIKSADCVVLSKLWVALVNKRSFLFFNDLLQYSKIFQAEPNPTSSITILQRYDEIITLREDKKLLKFWKFELLSDVEIEAREKADQLEQARKEMLKPTKGVHEQKDAEQYKNFQKRVAMNYESEKSRLLSKHYFPLHLSLFARRGHIQPTGNRIIMQFSISEELSMLAMSFETQEIFIYHLFTCDVLHTIDILKVPPTISENPSFRGVVNLVIDQEFLYFCDEKRFYVRDLLTHEETSVLLPSMGKIVGMHAERSNQNGGVYLLTTDDYLHTFSYQKRSLPCTCIELKKFFSIR